MSIRPFRDIKRRKTKTINLGNVKVGGDNPISVLSRAQVIRMLVEEKVKKLNGKLKSKSA